MKSIRLRPSLIPLDAQAVFCSCMPFFGPPDGLSRFGAKSFCTGAAPWRRGRRGFAFQAVTADEIKSPRKCNRFSGRSCIVRGADAPGGPFGNAFDIRRPTARPPRSNWTTGNCQPPINGWNHPPRIRTDDRQSKPFFTLLSHYSVRMHFVCSRMQSVCTFCPRAKSQ